MMKKLLTVQVTNDGYRDPIPSETTMAHTINGLKRKFKAYDPSSWIWICVASDKELSLLELYEVKHKFAVLRYEEHEVIGDD